VVAGGAHLFLRQLWIILGSLALLIGALLLLDRRVTQPVKVLRGAMNRRMAGTLSGPVEVGGPAEVSSLATDFNHLISEIDQELEANARLAAIVESSDDAIFGMSLDGTITSWNHSAEQLYGYDADELLGENVIRLLAEEERLAFKGYLERVSQGEAIGHHDRRRVRKNGSQVDVAVTLFPVRDQFDRIIGASSAARDITQRIRTEAQLAVQAEDLLRSNAELEQFAYVASHDLSEPLRTISGYVELLNKRYNEKLDPDADRFIQYTVDGCNRMRQLIDDLLTFSRTGRSEKLTESVDCSNVVDMVVRDMAANRETLGASIDYEALPFVRGDRGQITQLFQNLIANSLKFSRRDVPPEVRISAVRRGRMWQIELSDNGIGIEPEYRERIFGMFQRLHPRDEYPGTGIGLAVCKRIVQAHRGEIWLGDSEIGSVFVFTLPIAEDEE
jgi:PAS domain S-box-containing protein